MSKKNLAPDSTAASALPSEAQNATGPTYSATLLKCLPGKRATKLYRDPIGKPESYDAGIKFLAYEHNFESFAAFAEYLAELASNVFLIRGSVKPEVRPHVESGGEVRRLVYDDRAKDGTLICEAAFEPCARNWIVLDKDEGGTPLDLADPEGSVRAWHDTLPDEIRHAESAFFFSSSAHGSPTVRGKLVVALAAPLEDSQAAAYAYVKGFDGSVCHAVQPNYFAAPVFEGCADPAEQLRVPVFFEGTPTTLPVVDARKQKPRVTLPPLAELPPADAGIVAALGDHGAHRGRRYYIIGALAGIMHKGGFTEAEWAAVVQAWIPLDTPGETVESALDQWARTTFSKDSADVSGHAKLAELIGDEHAYVVEYACAREAPNYQSVIGKGVFTELAKKVEAAHAAREAADAKPYVEFAGPVPTAPTAPAAPKGKSFAALADYVRARAAVAYDVRQLATVRAADGRRWIDADTAHLRLELSAQNLEAKKETLSDVVELVAHENEFDPVVRYLEALAAWDGVTRSGFVQCFGATAGPWADACWRVFSVSAVARALNPGCKVDTMVVLEGAQGLFKSTALKALAGAEFFSDTIFPMDSAKQAIEGLQGVWIQEIAELSGLRGRDAEKIKASLSSPADRARLAYGRFTEAVPRRSVFVATRNPDGSQWLVDPTGNRRYLPLAVGRVDLESIKRDRDQLWAEAVHRYRAGEPWWLQTNETVLHASEASERTEADPWVEPVTEWLRTHPKADVTIAAVFDPEKGAVPTFAERQTQATANRMARVLKSIGYIRRQVRKGLERQWVYVRALMPAGAVPSPVGVTSFGRVK